MISYRLADDSFAETPGPPMLSERQAAHYLELSLDQLRHHVNLGELRFLGTRAKKKFLQRELDVWKERHAIFSKKKKRR